MISTRGPVSRYWDFSEYSGLMFFGPRGHVSVDGKKKIFGVLFFNLLFCDFRVHMISTPGPFLGNSR